MEDKFLLGQHEALLQQMVKGQSEIFDRLGSIEQTLAERRGERRAGTFVWGSLSGVVGSAVVFVTKAWMAAHGATR